jgi:two-component system, NtrC family, response regulator PilR
MKRQAEVIVVTTDLFERQALEPVFARQQLRPVYLTSVREARARLARTPGAVVFCDAKLADGSFRDLLVPGPARGERPRVVVLSRTAETKEYLEAMRQGAFDFLGSPLRPRDVEWVLSNALRRELAAAV